MWIFLLIFANVLIKIQCNSNADCDIEEVTESDWLTAYINDPVYDHHENEFKKFTVKNIQGVKINGTDYGKYFDVILQADELIILPTDEFKNFEINEKSIQNPGMHVGLDFICRNGNKELLFYQPIKDKNTYRPIFEKPLYVYNLPMPLPAEFDISLFGTNIVACDLDISNVRLDFSIDPVEDFYVSWDGPINHTNKCHKMKIKTINPLKLKSEKKYEITVTDTGILVRINTVEMKIHINEETSLPLNPYFEFAHYKAIYDLKKEKHTISVSTPIRLKRGCSKLKFEILELEYKDKFRVECNLETVAVNLVDNLPDDVWNKLVLFVTIQATLEYAERPGKTVLEIYFSEMEQLQTSTVDTCDAQCSSCPPILYNTDCPIASPAPAVPPEKKYASSTLHYKTETYVITVTYCHIGYLETITAMAHPQEDIKYYLPFESNFLEYNKSTGVLKKTDCTIPNIMHYFKVCAEGLTTKSDTCTDVLVHETGSYAGSLSSAITYVQHVVEEREGFIQLPCNYRCTCTIFEQFPVISEELFMCESSQIYASALDREMEEIANMKFPQFTLHLNLEAADVSREKRDTKNKFKELVLIPRKVFDEHNQILLTIIIDDINDNPPTFSVGKKLIVGYPVKELANLITPPYLAKVVATDPDAGENATIRYSLNATNPIVVIHPETGIIYPCLEAFENTTNLTFTVRATDRNGAEDGLWTDLDIEVKLLMHNHILNIKLNNTTPDEVDEMMVKLSRATDFRFRYLIATFMLENDAPNYFTEITAYAFNVEYEPVNATDLEEALENLEGFPEIMKKNIEFIASNEGDHDRYSITTCITIPAIILLLLVLVAGTGVYCHYKCVK